MERTSSPACTGRITTTSIRGPFPPGDVRGKTTTAFGAHAWLTSATAGASVTPSGERAGELSVIAFVANYSSIYSYFSF